MSGEQLGVFVSACSKLKPEFLFYCDNILDGPYSYSASGCRNVFGRGNKFCCRKGQH